MTTNIATMPKDLLDSKQQLDHRKAAILEAIIREYISTAQPVGSGSISEAPGVEVSSATVRNEMAALENDDYLCQPHTSAGRVPTPKGYRYFVDKIRGMAPNLDTADRRQVSDFFSVAHNELSTMLNHTTGLLSDLTDWAGLVVSPSPVNDTVRSVQLVDIAPGRVLLVAVMSSGAVENRALEVDPTTTSEEVDAASQELTARIVGRSPTTATTTATTTPTTTDDSDATLTVKTSTLADTAIRALSNNIDHHEVFVGGTAKLAAAFGAAEQLREVLNVLEQQLVVVSLIREVIDRGNRVAIGAESGIGSLSECSLVLAPYEVSGGATGTIGILGPTRMDYPQALSAVAVVSERLSSVLGDG